MEARQEGASAADAALKRLLEGNRRFRRQQAEHPDQSAEHRRKLIAGQDPFAVILGCSDSRVPAELIFDQGLGDLFVVRTAGHVVGDTVTASLEYAVGHLEVPLIVVLAHSSCGAVTAARQHGPAPGSIGHLKIAIQPAVAAAGADSPGAVDRTARIHACRMADRLRDLPPVLGPASAAGRLQVVPAFYELETGRVELIPTE